MAIVRRYCLAYLLTLHPTEFMTVHPTPWFLIVLSMAEGAMTSSPNAESYELELNLLNLVKEKIISVCC